MHGSICMPTSLMKKVRWNATLRLSGKNLMWVKFACGVNVALDLFLFFLPSFFGFDWLVEWACIDEGQDLARGHCYKYNSTRAADGCCHDLRTVRDFISLGSWSSPISRGAFASRSSGLAVSEHFWSCLWSDTAADRNSKHSHSPRHTHGHAHASFSTAAKLLRGFQTPRHVTHTLAVICKCPLSAERTVYFFLNKWPHTLRGRLILRIQLSHICFPTVHTTEW